MTLTPKRISQLADRIIWHLVHDRPHKALLIAQYLRRANGGHMVMMDSRGQAIR